MFILVNDKLMKQFRNQILPVVWRRISTKHVLLICTLSPVFHKRASFTETLPEDLEKDFLCVLSSLEVNKVDLGDFFPIFLCPSISTRAASCFLLIPFCQFRACLLASVLVFNLSKNRSRVSEFLCIMFVCVCVWLCCLFI